MGVLAVSCVATSGTASLCVATDANGDVIVSTNPTSGVNTDWHKLNPDGSVNIDAVDCSSPTLCVASDINGNVITSTNATAGASSTWTKAKIDGSATLASVGCAASGLCLTGDSAGTLLGSSVPAGGAYQWGGADVDGTAAVNGSACPSSALCVAADNGGKVLVSTNPVGTLTSTTVATVCESSCPTGYDTGDVESVTDPDGNVTAYTYDAQGDVITTTDTAGWQVDTTDDSYDILGQRFCEVAPQFSASVTCPSSQASHNADTTGWVYDADGNVSTTTDADGRTTSYAYDADGNVTQVEDGLTNLTKTTYDADDRPTAVTSGYTSSAATTTDFFYDIVPGSCPSAPTGTTYCTQSENVGLSQTTTKYFNALDQTIEEAPPNTTDQAVATATYDGVGNLLTETNASGTSTYGYDADNRVNSISYSTSEHTVGYQYDADGNRTQMTDGTGTTNYAYDPLERLRVSPTAPRKLSPTPTTRPGTRLVSSYPNSGSTTCQMAIVGTGLVAYGYDGLNRVAQMTDWVTPAVPTTFGYDGDSNLRTTTYPTTTTPVAASDEYNDADVLQATNFGVNTLNADEFIGTTTPTGGSTATYGYDALNRVTTGTNAGFTASVGSPMTPPASSRVPPRRAVPPPTTPITETGSCAGRPRHLPRVRRQRRVAHSLLLQIHRGTHCIHPADRRAHHLRLGPVG